MSEKPTPLFLIVLAGIGTGLLSPLNVNGTPVLVLVVPFAILTALLYNAETAIQVGIGASILSGIFVHALGLWSIVAYALAATTTILAYDAIYPKQKNELNASLFAVLGVLLYEFFHELYTRENMLFRPEIFMGTNPVLGIQIVGSVLVAGILFYQWVRPAGKK
ncbi:MAG: hypothetical protein FJY86_02390 [Candidatus Diapherotrites archaeon]|uniref:Uncharacterized protein n=1 Tax=Candidatus Iainarchaeum sp. TaxID=3101447 RepID=A0A8T4C6L4_9ARCH|nr:hypothetical protein [Candidatus Diapherotrites archaeon]